MTLNRIRKEDISDIDIVDAYELASDGYGNKSIYLSTACISTTASTNRVVVSLASDGEGLLNSYDHPVQQGDIVWISGTSGGVSDGYFTINSIIDNLTFSINEVFLDSTGGTVRYQHPAGASKVGFDSTNTTFITSDNIQQALEDLDQSISATGLDPVIHEKLRQLIHLADGVGGPLDGFPSGVYREALPAGSIKPNSITWYLNNTKINKIVEKIITYNSKKLPITFSWSVYKTNGTTILSMVTDTLTYVGSFEASRIRSITDFSSISGNLDINSHRTVRQLIHLADGIGGPFEGFTSGAYREITSAFRPFPTSIIWYEDISKVKKIIEKTVTYNANKSVSSVSWKVYDIDGITILATVSDAIAYSGIFEINRTRTIT